MTNLTKLVHTVLDQDTALRRDMGRDLINTRALANYLQRKLHLSGSVDAIISAIRRYENAMGDEDRFAKARALLRTAKLSTKNNITIIALVKDPAVQQLLPKLFTLIDYARGEVLRIIQAEELIKVVVDQKNAAAVAEIFPKGKLVHTEKNLAEVNMRLEPVSSKVPGVLAMLDTELANNGVNIVETMSCVPEVIWFLSEKDLLRAHETFLNLIAQDD